MAALPVAIETDTIDAINAVSSNVIDVETKLDSVVKLLERLVALEEERREAERPFEEMAKAMSAPATAEPVDERDPNDPRGRR